VISQDNRSLVIGISFTAHDPNLAAAFVNTLVADYIATRADRRQTANQGANTVMSQRIEQVRQDINSIEQKMRALRTSSDMVGLRAGSVGQQQVEDLATAASRATLDRSQIEAQYERAAALASSGSSDALASVLGSETISRLREQEAEAAAKVADLSMRYGANWPALRSAEADLSSIRRQIAGESHRIVDSLATQLRVARAHEADVLAQLSAARHEGVAAENVQAELTQLQQDAATRRDLYRTLLERAEQTGAEPLHDEMPDIRVLSQAVPPGLPSAPNVKAATGLGGLAGGLLAGVFALAFTTRRGGLIDAETVARVEGLTIIATLPGKSALAGAGRAGLAARVLANPAGEEAGAMRMARARVGQISRRAPRKIGFVGAQTGTAAASAAAAFGRIAALDGQRVLLVAADAAQPDMARVLGVVGERAASGDWRDGVMQDASGMDVLPGCATAQGGVALENLLAEANEDYDVIVLGAPAVAQQDALTLARSCDVTVLVIEARVGVTAALEARGRLSSMSRSPLAAILFAPR
jgi:Mrp family chromosome partitioning ATPase